jgi:type IX secretion system PorP/SprF family membrane protein
MKKIIFILAFLNLINIDESYAQQEAMNTQFVVNKLFINPGYAGYREQAMVTAIHRSQWLGFKGAPNTQIVSFDTPLKRNELAVGATLWHDKIGPTSRLAVSGDFAYRLRLVNHATLSFGAKASVELFQNNLTTLNLTSDYYNQQDESFMYNTRGLFLMNVGFGAFYSKKDHFIGISCPKLLRPRLDKKSNPGYGLLSGKQEPTIYFTGGKIWKINKDISIQPTAIVRATFNAPLSVGIYANVIFLKDFTGGLFYHYQESAGLLFQWQFDKQWKVGYSFDLSANALIRTNYGSHELSAIYALKSKKKRIVYPRYF